MDKQRYIEQLFDAMRQLRKYMEGQTPHDERAATLMQFSALKFLGRHDAGTVGTLAAHLGLSKSSATQLVERLVKAGLVERRSDDEDKRIVRLKLLQAGEDRLSFMEKKYVDKMAAVFTKIPDKDLRELIRIHTELIETLQKEKKETWNK